MRPDVLIHCCPDIKASNILIKKDGTGRLAAVIADFGVAMSFEEEKVKARRNIQLQAASVAYASPEVLTMLFEEHESTTMMHLSMQSSRNPARDVYALGIVLWELLMGDEAWAGEPFARIDQLVRVNDVRPRSESSRYGQKCFQALQAVYGSAVIEQCNRLVQQCWSRTVTDRPNSSAVKSLLSSLSYKQPTGTN
jgi:serine/threonine protein kinase